MEQFDKLPLKFEIITGDESLIKKVVEEFNKEPKRLFEVVGFEDRDGDIFARLELKKGTLSDVFQLGCNFGMRIEVMRHRNEIDW
ncbi:hypothetical protein [Arsenicibacter rosenii]|uniref:Uncharacterized protein n=1 Tax=Arsenicibacter rosenii TaxID=1750698 RepID=A0A1S2VQA6_9BACT|nr:hypothetical protein [Arsenicibacter rosenii]OIN60963.1 hypothetical protein BLX24_02450 [Arsenicibacter rosenii]